MSVDAALIVHWIFIFRVHDPALAKEPDSEELLKRNEQSLGPSSSKLLELHQYCATSHGCCLLFLSYRFELQMVINPFDLAY